MRKVLFLLAAFTFLVALPVYAANVAGTWTLTQSGPQGKETFDVVIAAKGHNLSITANHPMLKEMKGTGTIKGNHIKMDLKTTGQMKVEFVYKGKVTGNKMAGTKEIKMLGGSGGRSGAPGGGQGGQGGQGGAPPSGGHGGAPSGGQGGQGGQGGSPGNLSKVAKAWSAVRK